MYMCKPITTTHIVCFVTSVIITAACWLYNLKSALININIIILHHVMRMVKGQLKF